MKKSECEDLVNAYHHDLKRIRPLLKAQTIICMLNDQIPLNIIEEKMNLEAFEGVAIALAYCLGRIENEV